MQITSITSWPQQSMHQLFMILQHKQSQQKNVGPILRWLGFTWLETSQKRDVTFASISCNSRELQIVDSHQLLGWKRPEQHQIFWLQSISTSYSKIIMLVIKIERCQNLKLLSNWEWIDEGITKKWFSSLNDGLFTFLQ